MNCDPQIESAVKEWHEHLKGHPPSLQDWKDSGYRFTTSADETAQASAHPGSPIAIPSLVDEKEP
ncbi:MAG: hypothetical protein CMH56_06405 [Myxococcales bacterium]|nr:hypothetical protein [Myxococcales bacterium]